jgi:hypothetical protein
MRESRSMIDGNCLEHHKTRTRKDNLDKDVLDNGVGL